MNNTNEIRKQMNMSEEELANKAQIAVDEIKRFEMLEDIMDENLTLVIKIAQALGVGIDKLIL